MYGNTRSIYLITIWISLFFITPLSYANENTAFDHINKAAKSGSLANFKGEFVRQTSLGLSTYLVTRLTDKTGRVERRIAADGIVRELLLSKNRIDFYTKKDNPKGVLLARMDSVHLFPDILPLDTKVLLPAYIIEAGIDSRAANRKCQWIWFVPKDSYRYKQGLCLDRETYFPLVHVYQGQNDKLIEISSFTTINFKKPLEKEIIPNKKLEIADSIQMRPQLSGKQAQYNKVEDSFITHLPEYFFILKKSDTEIGGKQGRQYFLGDGLISVSLFLEEYSKTNKPERMAKQISGAMSLAIITQGKYKLTAIGDLPPGGLLKLLEKTQFK